MNSILNIMMRLLVIVLIFTTVPLFAQSIKVISSDDLQPIPFAHVNLHNLKDNSEQLVITNQIGEISLNEYYQINSKYVITISYLGYKNLIDTLFDQNHKTYYLSPEKTVLNEVIVTAQYAPNSPEKAVHKIKIIDSKKIEAMAAVNLKDVLTNELNIRISEDNILGSSMSLQGISGQNVKLLIDGVPVTGRLNGNIDISQINMNNVERIEIVEGPLSVSYGTDALGGTINIITKKTQKESFSTTITSYYESSGQYNNTGKIGFKKKNHLLNVSGGRNFFDGWRSNEKPFHIERERIADTLRFKHWKPKEQLFGTFFYAYYFKKLKLGYTGDYFYEQVTNRGLPRLPYYESAFDDYYTTKRINNSINLTGPLNKNLHLNIIAAYNIFTRIKKTYVNDLTTLEQRISENTSDHDTSAFNNLFTRGTLSRAKDTAFVNYELGYDINHETAFGVRIKNEVQSIGDYAVFSTAEIKPVQKFTIRPGLRIIYNTDYKAPIVPSVNLKYNLINDNIKSQTLTLRFSYARGFRAPSLKELYFFFVDINHNINGNENLKAEQSNNFNFSASFNKNKGEKAWKTEFSLFYNNITNMISLAQSSTTLYSYFNVDVFKTAGVQLQNEYAINHLKISIGGAYVGRYNQLSRMEGSDTYAYSPEGRCNLMYEWNKQHLTFSVFYKYTGSLPSFALNENDEVYKNIIQEYHTADCSVSKKLFRKNIAITSGIKNMFDVTNIVGTATGGAHTAQSNSIAVAMGRIYFLKLEINLNGKK